jgi:hypothetical protein
MSTVPFARTVGPGLVRLQLSFSVLTEFTVTTGKQQISERTPGRNVIGHTHARASNEQAWETNGILKCKTLSKTRTVPNGRRCRVQYRRLRSTGRLDFCFEPSVFRRLCTQGEGASDAATCCWRPFDLAARWQRLEKRRPLHKAHWSVCCLWGLLAVTRLQCHQQPCP